MSALGMAAVDMHIEDARVMAHDLSSHGVYTLRVEDRRGSHTVTLFVPTLDVLERIGKDILAAVEKLRAAQTASNER